MATETGGRHALEQRVPAAAEALARNFANYAAARRARCESTGQPVPAPYVKGRHLAKEETS